jgi:hypothetical protein
MTWNEITELFVSTPEGSLITDKEGNPWVKPKQDRDFHLDDMLICLKDGKILHYSRVMEYLNDNTAIKCKTATCDNMLVLDIHPLVSSGTFFIGYYCNKCGWTKFVGGPYQTDDELLPVLKRLKENYHA